MSRNVAIREFALALAAHMGVKPHFIHDGPHEVAYIEQLGRVLRRLAHGVRVHDHDAWKLRCDGERKRAALVTEALRAAF